MLHFCSISDITAIFPVASRYNEQIIRARESVTMQFNRYMRRNLEYAAGNVEFFDAVDTRVHEDYKIWLEKKRIVGNSVVVNYSQTREFDLDNVIESQYVVIEPENGRLLIAGRLYPGKRIIKVVYDGGYPALSVNNQATDAMDCPADLRQAAVDQAVFDLKRGIGQNQGQAQDTDGKKGVIQQRSMVGGLLADVAATLSLYRRPLGT